MLQKAAILFFMLVVALTGCGPDSQEVSGDVNAGPDQVNGIAINGSAAIILDMILDVYSEPDVRARRITQAFYNQAVSILEEDEGWDRIIAPDGNSGWVRSKFIDRDVSSVSGRAYTHRIIVTGKEKSIFSDPSGGITVMDAVMGSVFYSFNNSDNAYEVYLPGGKTGWLRGSGIIHVGLEAGIPVTSGKDFASSALKFKGTSFLLNGLSSMGIDSPGMIYICAKVNGIDVPRDLKGQMDCGEKIALDAADAGDVVFLGDPGDPNAIVSAGVCLGNGQYVHASKTLGYVKLDGLNESGTDGKPVFARRIFR